MGFLTKRTTVKQRNILGCIVAFLLSCLLNVFGIAIMVYREYHQSMKGGFPIEWDDIKRYTWSGLLGAVVNVLLIVLIFA